METNNPGTGCFSSSQATSIAPHGAQGQVPMLCRTWRPGRCSQLEGSRLPEALELPSLHTQAALALPGGHHAASRRPPGGLTPGCPVPPKTTSILGRFLFPNVPIASLGIVFLFSRAPIIAGIYGALTMNRALTPMISKPHNRQSNLVFPCVPAEGLTEQANSQRVGIRAPECAAFSHTALPRLLLRPAEEGQGQWAEIIAGAHRSHTPCSMQPRDAASPGQISGGG